jgi:hypothetical protein
VIADLPLPQKVNVKVTLLLAVYRLSVRLTATPLETHDQRLFFLTKPLRLKSLCNIPSDEKMGFVSYEYVWSFVKSRYRTFSMILKIIPFTLYTSPLSVQALQSRSLLSCVSYATTAA